MGPGIRIGGIPSVYACCFLAQSFDASGDLWRYAERMKLLMISGDRSILQGKKGAFWYTLEEMAKHWERVDVVCPRPDGIENLKLKIENKNPFPNVFFHPSSQGLVFQTKWIVRKGKELIAEHHHDVMTAHEYPPFYNGMGACHLHQATGVPYCLEIHHIVGYPVAASVFEWIGRVASRWQIPKSAHHASAVRVVNAEVKEILAKWGIPAAKIQIVPSFYLDSEKLKADTSIVKKYDLVFCARLTANKGLADVIRVLQSLPHVTMLVIGNGPERASCEALARSLGISDRVTFVGWLPDQAAVISAMQSAKILVMHSKSEGGPRVALEAMAIGMPVIATKVGVLPELIQDGVNGVFTDGSADGLRATMELMVGDQELREKIGGEARRILGRFERKKLVKEYAEFLKYQIPSTKS